MPSRLSFRNTSLPFGTSKEYTSRILPPSSTATWSPLGRSWTGLIWVLELIVSPVLMSATSAPLCSWTTTREPQTSATCFADTAALDKLSLLPEMENR